MAHSLPSPLISQTDICPESSIPDGSIALQPVPAGHLGIPRTEQYLTDRAGEPSGWIVPQEGGVT